MIDKITREEKKVLLKKVINDTIKNPRLTPWEREFLFSVNKQILVRDLSEKQLNVLNRIKQKLSKR